MVSENEMKKDIHFKIRACLITIWGVLVVFAVIWSIEPQWLRDISSQGKIVEASENKLKGDELLRQGEYKLAYKAYFDALKIMPEMQSAQIGKAISLYKMGNLSEALKIYIKLLEKGADKPWEVYFNLAAIYETQRDKEKTIEALKSFIKLSPDPFDGQVRLARLYFTSSNWKQALNYYRLAFQSKPDLENSLISTLKSERVIYQKDSLVVKEIDKLLKTGISDELSGRFYSQPFEEELNKNPVIAMIYNDAGFCYAMHGDIDSSLPFFQTAVKLQPDNREYRQNLLKAQHELEKKDN